MSGISLIDGRDWLLLVEVGGIAVIVFGLEIDIVVAAAARRTPCSDLVT